ncbi:hypothetical protein SLE2022_373360 [Rubroshorea leprosula]
MTNNDQDAARGRKNIKCLAYVFAGVIAQTAIIRYASDAYPQPQGTLIGEATIVKARARARTTKKVNVTFVASSGKVSSNSQLGDDIESGIIPLGSHARLDGKIILFKVFKKKKSAEMNCIMDVNTTTKEIQNLKCK